MKNWNPCNLSLSFILCEINPNLIKHLIQCETIYIRKCNRSRHYKLNAVMFILVQKENYRKHIITH